jgi:CRP/FNR family transcriptional regulator, cyclic AMP receptor protein
VPDRRATSDADRSDLLADVALLDSVPADELRRIADDVRESVFPAGTEVVREGDDDGVGFFVVVAGQASVEVGGREVGSVGPGDHFGALSAIDGGPRTASVRATTELRCLILTAARFHELVHDHPGVAWRLLVYLAGIVRAEASAGAGAATV